MIKLPVGASASSHAAQGAYTVQPQKIIALGLNYRDHIKESVTAQAAGAQDELPAEPILFPKTPNVLIGPDEQIRIPRILAGYGFQEPRTDYEGELAVIIGQRTSMASVERAEEAIFGFTCFNDVSQRNIQKGDRSGWFRGKSFDTFGPIGPVVIPLKALRDYDRLRIRTRLNGETVQDASTGDMIFSVPEIIAFISRNMTLEAGDIVVTGTPSGVGPIRHGDTVEVDIEGIGVLRNSVIDERLDGG
jgi:2-keto-4-pentenoate hydratase/2-oxohepta-3-ene-1,7-dioic acid hydratase in catechol pathway